MGLHPGTRTTPNVDRAPDAAPGPAATPQLAALRARARPSPPSIRSPFDASAAIFHPKDPRRHSARPQSPPARARFRVVTRALVRPGTTLHFLQHRHCAFTPFLPVRYTQVDPAVV